MTFEIVPGNALGCRTNAHRHGWDGSICDEAADWACGIEADFRTKYCRNEIPRCFHLHLFDEEDPHLVIPDSGVGWILGRLPEAFDDQILLIWAPQAEEPHGMTGGRPAGSFMAGAFRVQNVERIEQRNHVEWKIHPYDDGWAYMGCLDLQAPRFIHLGGPYIKQVEGSSVISLFEGARDTAKDLNEVWTEAERERLENFTEHLEEWLANAEERATKMMGLPRSPQPRQAGGSSGSRGTVAARSGSASQAEPDSELRTRVIPIPPRAPREAPPEHFPLVEPEGEKAIGDTYGRATLLSIQAASLSRPLLILHGEPGVGKSHQALRLLDDARRDRTVIVPVSATWHGQESLLGRLNRARHQFEPTVFTNFLRSAHLAWDDGDYATRLVVFENFDHAPPESWLAEILLRIQYPVEQVRDRTLFFEGESVRGWEGPNRTRLFLSPAVRFVATVDDPAHPGTLTSRLLDDAATIRLEVKPERVLSLTGVELPEEQVVALSELNEATRLVGPAVTFTTARSIKVLLENLEELGIDSWRALDLVLGQELVAKLELHDPASVDEGILAQLAAWCRGPGTALAESSRRIQAWTERSASPATVGA